MTWQKRHTAGWQHYMEGRPKRRFLRNAEMGELPETARKKISEILAVLKKYENKDKKPLSGHSR